METLQDFSNKLEDALSKLTKQINEELYYVKPMTEQEIIDHDIMYAKFKQENPECCCDYCSNYEKCDCEACGY